MDEDGNDAAEHSAPTGTESVHPVGSGSVNPSRTQVHRVALVLSELRAGGMERVVTHIARVLPRHGVEPLVICIEGAGQLADMLTDAGIRVAPLHSRKGGFDFRVILRLARRLREFDPSIINVHDYASMPYVMLARYLCPRRPVVFTAHGLLYNGFEKHRMRYTLSAKRLAGVTAVSPEVAARHAEHLRWPHAIDIVPNGVPEIDRSRDLRQKVRAELGISPDSTVFLAVGNVRPEKGFEDLLAAADLLRGTAGDTDFTVLVVGGTLNKAYGDELLATQQSLGLEQTVRFLGFRDDTETLYSATDAFVLSSRSEGMPMVILEAMMASLPIVATRVGGVPKVVSADTGLLCDAASPPQLCQAMGKLLGDRDLCRDMGRRGRQYAAANYGVEKMVSRYIETFDRVIAESVGKGRGGRT